MSFRTEAKGEQRIYTTGPAGANIATPFGLVMPTANGLARWRTDAACYKGADTAGGACADGENCYSVADMLGVHHINQNSSSWEFTYKTNILNGKGILRSTDNNRAMWEDITMSEPYWFVMVVKPTAWAASMCIVNSDNGDAAAHTLEGHTSSPKFSMRTNLTQGADVDISLNVWHVIGCCFNGASSYMRVDGNAAQAINTDTAAITGFSVGYRSATGYSCQMDWADVALFSGAATFSSGDSLLAMQVVNSDYALGYTIA